MTGLTTLTSMHSPHGGSPAQPAAAQSVQIAEAGGLTRLHPPEAVASGNGEMRLRFALPEHLATAFGIA